MNTAARTSRPLPGHKVVNLIIAVFIWLIGVYFTARALTIGAEYGPFIPWAAAVGLQALFSAAQSNLRIFGLSAARWPFIALTIADVAINMAGLLINYVEGVVTLGDAALFTLYAVTTGDGLWQCGIALIVAGLIAAAPEQMVRDALNT